MPFPVLPSEVVLLSAGFLSSENRISVVVAGLLATAATLIGNSILFSAGRHFGRSAIDRYGKYVHLRPERVLRIEEWVSRRGTPMLLYGPLIPLIRAYIPAVAGIFGVPFRFYISVLVFAAVVWSFGLLIIGNQLGARWFDAVELISPNVRIAIICGLLVVLLVAFLVNRWRHKSASAQPVWRDATLDAHPEKR